MNKRLNSFEDLLKEKARLTEQLAVQKEQLKEDIRVIKEDLKPVGNALSTAALFISRSTKGNGLAHLGVNVAIDLLIKRFLLSKAGWLTRQLVPFFMKNYSSHIVDEPDKFLDKIKGIFKRKHHPGMDAVQNQ